jgi:hypothetical protein
MNRILIGVVIAIVTGGAAAAQSFEDRGYELGARWYCLARFKGAGMTAYNNDPLFLNCVRKRVAQAKREWNDQVDRQRPIIQRRQQELRQEYGR